jgi:hypothetical protein
VLLTFRVVRIVDVSVVRFVDVSCCLTFLMVLVFEVVTFWVFALFDVSGGLCCLPFRVVCVV